MKFLLLMLRMVIFNQDPTIRKMNIRFQRLEKSHTDPGPKKSALIWIVNCEFLGFWIRIVIFEISGSATHDPDSDPKHRLKVIFCS